MNFVLDNILYERWQCGKRFRGFVSNDLVKLRELVTCDEGETEVEVLNEPFNPFLSGDRRWRFAYRSQ